MSKVLKVGAAIVGVAALTIMTAGAATFGIGLAAAASSVTVAGLSASTLFLVSAGLSAASGLLAKRPKAPSTSDSAKDRLQVTIDPRTPRKFVFGRTAMATDLRDQEIIGSNQDYVDRFVVVASHAVQSIEEIWFDDKLAWSSSGGVGSDFSGYLTVNTRLEGSAANAINISARMGSTRRYTGLAYVYLRYKLTGNSKKATSPFQQSIPSRVTIVGKGAKVYDPRLDSTVPGGSGPQRADDQTTWAWNDNASRNPALQLLWYLLGWRIQNPSTGAWRLAVGKGIPPARIDLASFITAANLCDEPVTLAAGGTEPRYRSDGVFSEADATGTVIEQLKATMNAELDDVDGKLRLIVLHNDLATPIADFSEDDILDDFTWDQTTSLDDTFNVVRGTYIDPSTNSLYQAVDYPEVRIASPDGIDRIETVDLQLVQSPSQAQRLAKQRVARMLYSGTFTATFGHRAWKVQRCDVVRLSFKPLGLTNKLFRVVDTAVQVDGQVPMVLREEHPDIYLWDKEEAPAVAPVAPTTYDPAKDPLYTYVVNNAGAGAFTMVPHGNTAALDYTPTSVTKTDTGGGWDAGCYSRESYSFGCTASARFGDPTKDAMFGLNSDPAANASFNTIDYAIYNDPAVGSVSVWLNGIFQQTLQASVAAAADIWAVRHDPTAGTVAFYKNGSLIGTPIATASGRQPPFAFDSSLYNAGASLLDIVFVGSGAKGVDGNVPTLATIYKRSATTPALPTATATFDPYANTITGLNNGWTRAVPAANGQQLWVSAAPAVIIPPATTDTIAAGEWASPVIDSQDGAAGAGGYSVVTVELYQRNNTGVAPSTPGSTLTFDFTTGVLSGTLGSWSQSDPPASNGKYLFRTIAAALATAPATTDTIASGEWQAAQQFVKDGDNAKTATISQSSVAIACTYAGAVKPGQLGKQVSIRVMDGNTNVTSSTSFSKTDNGGVTTSGPDASGLITLTAFTGSGSTNITPTYAGVELAILRVSWTADPDPQPPQTPTSVNKGYLSSYTGTSFASSPGPETGLLIVGASGNVQITTNGEFSILAPPSGTRNLNFAFTIGYRIGGSGSGYTLLSEQNGFEASAFAGAPNEPGDNSPGGWSLVFHATGLVSGQTYEWGLFQRKISGTGTLDGAPSGYFIAEQE